MISTKISVRRHAVLDQVDSEFRYWLYEVARKFDFASSPYSYGEFVAEALAGFRHLFLLSLASGNTWQKAAAFATDTKKRVVEEDLARCCRKKVPASSSATAQSVVAALLLFCVFLFSPAVHAQPPIQAPTPAPTPQHFHPRVYWTEVSALIGAAAFDGYTTVRDTEKGIPEVQSPWLYGRHPSALRYALPTIGIGFAESFAGYRMEHSRHAWLRNLGHALILGDAASHVEAGAHNLTLPPQTCVSTTSVSFIHDGIFTSESVCTKWQGQ